MSELASETLTIASTYSKIVPYKTRVIGKKNVLVECPTANTATLYLGISFGYTDEHPAIYDSIEKGAAKFYGAPRGMSVQYLWFYTASGNQVVTYTASDGAISRPVTIAQQSMPTDWTSGVPYSYAVTMVNLDTEYSQALPANCKRFIVKTRDGTAFRLAFVTGKVAAPTDPYTTIPTSVSYDESNLLALAQTLYFACAVAGKIVEIIAWA